MEANNMKEMRDALKVIRGMVNEELEDLKDISDEVRADFISIRGWCDHALAKPPRQCDVGTPEEQEVRFRNYCWNHSSRDKNMECQCPIDVEGKAGCKLEWAQLPYNESEAGK